MKRKPKSPRRNLNLKRSDVNILFLIYISDNHRTTDDRKIISVILLLILYNPLVVTYLDILLIMKKQGRHHDNALNRTLVNEKLQTLSHKRLMKDLEEIDN